MAKEPVTIETIYNYLKEWQYELRESYQKEFEKDIYRRLDYTDHQLDLTNNRIEKIENREIKNQNKNLDITYPYFVTFLASVSISIIISFLTTISLAK